MVTSVFKRQEKKYLIDEAQRRCVEQAARQYMAPDAFGRTLVTSIYLDTPTRSIIARSLEKPIYKEKLRLRCYGGRAGEALVFVSLHGLSKAQERYGETLLEMPAFFELKKKYAGIVYKRRVRMSLAGAWAFSQGASFAGASSSYPLINDNTDEQKAVNLLTEKQIARELRCALERNGELAPSMAIMCQRTAWAPLDGKAEPRITFDDKLCCIDLAKDETQPTPIIEESASVMEIKGTDALPIWLIQLLSAMHAYPSSFSKYGQAALLMAGLNKERGLIHA